MPKLYPEAQLHPDAESIATVLSYYGLPLLPYRAVSSGIENLTLLVGKGNQRYVLRVYRQGKKSDMDIATELDFMEVLRQAGLPLPTLQRTNQGKLLLTLHLAGQRWQCLLMDHVPGRHPSYYSSTLIENMALLQARMHVIGQEYAQRHSLVPNYSALRVGVDEAALHERLPTGWQTTEIHTFFERAQHFMVELPRDLPAGMSHFDYDADNLFADKSGRVTAILDFDDAQCLPLVVCLSHTLWDIFVADESNGERAVEFMNQYLRHYQEVRPLTSAEFDLLPRSMLLRHYQVAASDLTLGELRHGDSEAVLRQEAQLQTLGSRLRR